MSCMEKDWIEYNYCGGMRKYAIRVRKERIILRKRKGEETSVVGKKRKRGLR